MSSTQSPRRPTVKLGSQDVVHSYAPPGNHTSRAVHALRTISVPANLDTKPSPSFLYPPTYMSASPTVSILPIPPPPDAGGDSATPQMPQPNVQSIVIPSCANDEPPTPTEPTYEARVEQDPFETPSMPSMSAFPSSNDPTWRTPLGIPRRWRVQESEHTVYSTPVSGTMPMASRPIAHVNEQRDWKSSSASWSRRYPKGWMTRRNSRVCGVIGRRWRKRMGRGLQG